MKRLSIDIEEKDHQALKLAAVRADMSIKELVLLSVSKYLQGLA
jgi:hypothetical protein